MAKTPPKPQQTRADKVVAKLSAEQRDYLRSLISEHANATEIHRWLKEFDEELKYDSVLTWYKRELKLSQEVEEINALISDARGINCVDAHAASLAAVVRLTNDIRQSAVNVRDMSPTMLSNLVDLLREQRQSAQQLHTMQRLEDRRALTLSGGYRLAEILLNLTRDTDHYATMKGMLEGAIAKLESEM